MAGPKTLRRRKRREPFAHQKLVVLPEGVVRTALEIPLLSGLLPVAAGFFPAADGHFVERLNPLPEAIMILCVSGRGWVKVGRGKAQTVAPDSLALIAPGTVHAYGAEAVDPWSIYWAHFRGREVAEFFRLFGATRESAVVQLPAEAARRIVFRTIYERMEEDYTIPNLLSAAASLRSVLIELHWRQTRGGPPEKTDPIERTIIWMRGHVHERTDLSSLARHAGLSVAHYSELFRGRTGYSPVDYFLRMKVQHACGLLDTSDLRIEEIAALIGYEDPFYFSRLFRRIMAKSPRDYRGAAKG
jgi:AraC-like DNA-binding protein